MTENEKNWKDEQDKIQQRISTIGDVDLLDMYTSYKNDLHDYESRYDYIPWSQAAEDIIFETTRMLRKEILKRMTPKKTGKWIEPPWELHEVDDYGRPIYYTCSCCKENADSDIYDFCPNCGAEMESD